MHRFVGCSNRREEFISQLHDFSLVIKSLILYELSYILNSARLNLKAKEMIAMAYRPGFPPRHAKIVTANQFTGQLAQDKLEYSSLQAKLKQASLSEFLWKESKDLAEEALQTKFIQGVRLGNLEPEHYAVYSVQDVAYCQGVVDDYNTLIQRTEDQNVRAFFEQQLVSNKEYTQELMRQWHIKHRDTIKLGRAAKEYIDFEKKVANDYEPLYFVVVSIPCSRLWFWLANKIKPDAVSENLYQFWIDENSIGDGGAKLEDFVDGHASSLDEKKALKVYRKAMIGEINFFRSACGENLLSLN